VESRRSVAPAREIRSGRRRGGDAFENHPAIKRCTAARGRKANRERRIPMGNPGETALEGCRTQAEKDDSHCHPHPRYIHGPIAFLVEIEMRKLTEPP